MAFPWDASLVQRRIPPTVILSVPSILRACCLLATTESEPCPMKIPSPLECRTSFFSLSSLSDKVFSDPDARLMKAFVELLSCKAGRVVPLMDAFVQGHNVLNLDQFGLLHRNRYLDCPAKKPLLDSNGCQPHGSLHIEQVHSIKLQPAVS